MTSLYKFFLISFFAANTFAGVNKVGNGGDGVFCKDAKPVTAELLDFYEDKITFETKESDPYAIAEQRLQALNKVAPKLAAGYLKRLTQISKEIEFKKEVSLTDIPDSKHLFQPLSKGCEVLQVAIRKNAVLGDEKRFLIRDDLWQQFSSVNKAGLLTHEIIYEHFSKMDEKDSLKVRKLNRYIYQNNLNAVDFWKFIKDLEISIYP